MTAFRVSKPGCPVWSEVLERVRELQKHLSDANRDFDHWSAWLSFRCALEMAESE